MSKIMDFSRRHPWLIFLILAAGTLFSLLNINKIWIDSSIDSLMMLGDPEKIYYEETNAVFGADNMLVVYVEDENLFSVEKLTSLDSLVRKLSTIEGIRRVESLFSISNLESRGEYLYNNPLLDVLPEDDSAAADVMRRALKNPILLGNLISEDGRKTAVNIYLEKAQADSQDPFRNTVLAVDASLAEYEEQFAALFQLGTPQLQVELSDLITLDMQTLLLAALFVLLITLTITIRSASGAVLPLLTSGFSIFFTLGFMSFTGIPINLVTFIIPMLTIVIGSTEDIHILAEYQSGLLVHKDRKLAIRYVGRALGATLLLTSVTTFLGFFATSINRIVALIQFGISAGFALLVNPLITILLAPVYLSVFGAKSTAGIPPQKKSPRADNWFHKLHMALISRWRWLTLLFFFLLTGFFAIFIFNVNVDNSVTNNFKPDNPVLGKLETLHEELSGTYSLRIRLISSQSGVFKEPAFLEKIAAVQDVIRQGGDFDKTISICDYLQLINREMNGGDEAWYELPASRSLVEQYSIFLHRDEIQAYVNHDWSEACVLVRHNISSSVELKAALARLEAAIKPILENEEAAIAGAPELSDLEEDSLSDEALFADMEDLLDETSASGKDRGFFSEDALFAEIDTMLAEDGSNIGDKVFKQLPALNYGITGEGILTSRASDFYVQGQIFGIGIVLFTIFVIMIILFTNIKAGLISLLPNIFPIIVFYGVMGLFDIPLNVGTCMVAVVAIGISVDDTIHLMTRFNSSIRKTADPQMAIEEVLHDEVRPVTSTSIALTLGFATLAFAHVMPILHFGILASLTMLCALVADLFLTPILLSNVQLINLSDLVSMKVADALKNAPLFAGMSSYQIKKFILLCNAERKDNGKKIIRYGDTDQYMYLVLRGQIRIVIPEDGNDKAVELAAYREGAVFGELALLGRTPRSADVIADGQVVYLKIDWQGLEKIRRSSRTIAMKLYFNLANILGTRLKDAAERVSALERSSI